MAAQTRSPSPGGKEQQVGRAAWRASVCSSDLGTVMLTGKVIEPPTGIAAAGVVQVNGGPNTQPQPGGQGAAGRQSGLEGKRVLFGSWDRHAHREGDRAANGNCCSGRGASQWRPKHAAPARWERSNQRCRCRKRVIAS